ncbi:MAG: restriction endonuclease [Armatimonadia bacterium]|nr:restriction endonuclease [Armatimonadia bacterium]
MTDPRMRVGVHMPGTSDAIRVIELPIYSEARLLIRAIEGKAESALRGMVATLLAQTGTPQEPLDWTQPETWIPERLDGPEEDLAREMWADGDGALNPRYIGGALSFVRAHELVVADDGRFSVTERGTSFLQGDPCVVRELDSIEGVITVLEILEPLGNARRADLLPEWREHLKEHPTIRSANSVKSALWHRLRNLRERELVAREGHTYTITVVGAEQLSSAAGAGSDPKTEILRSITAYNKAQREALLVRLLELEPKAFEDLIGRLLDAMGYEDVEVTRITGDLGVDVKGSIQYGITTVTEMVQVKRTQSSIGRNVLSQLRGDLPLHDAIRGTLVTLGGFTKECEELALDPRAAPITLIDGLKLLELLVEHEIGVVRATQEIIEIDEDGLRATAPEHEEFVNL